MVRAGRSRARDPMRINFFNLPNSSSRTRLCYLLSLYQKDHVCGLVVRVPGATRFSEKQWVWNGVHSASRVKLKSYLKEKVAAPA
jgi:hypothetical protein